MPQTIKVQSGKTGKVYDMPWSLASDPTDDAIDQFIESQEKPQKSLYEKLNTGIVPVSRLGDALAEPLYKRSETPDFLGKAANVAGGFTQSLGNVLEGLTSPINLGLTAITGGAGLARGAGSKGLATALEGVNLAANTGMAGNALYKGVKEGDISQAIPFAMGAMGARGSIGNMRTTVPQMTNINPIKPVRPIVEKPPMPAEFTPVDMEPTSVPQKFPSSAPLDIIRERQAFKRLSALPEKKKLIDNTDATNAAIVKDAIENKIQPVSVIKPKTRANPDGSFDLLNPGRETIEQATRTGWGPKTGELNPDGSITMVKSIGPAEQGVIPTAPVTGPSPMNLQGRRNTPPFLEGTNGGNVPPNNPPPTEIQPVLPPAPPPRKFSLLTRTGNELKSATAGLDLSAPLRQGRALMLNKEWYTSLDDMFKSLSSEGGYQKVMDDIQTHPRFEQAQKAKLALTDVGGDLTQREEAIAGNLVEKLPGLGKAYHATNRAYHGFLNKLRMDTFNSLLDDIEKAGRPIDDEVLRGVADVVNNATGRASLGAAEGAAPLLNSLFFSPRFVTSRVKLITDPIAYRKADPIIRKQALKSLLGLVGTQATIAGLATLAGKSTLNPTSSDFAKVKFGNSRLDTNAGLQQILVLVSKLGSGRTTSTITGKTSKLDTGKFGSPTSGQQIWNFLTSKEAPILSLISEMWTGKDAVGNNREVNESIVRHVTPMLAQDIYDILKDDPKNAWLAIPGAFGASIQTYKQKNKKRTF